MTAASSADPRVAPGAAPEPDATALLESPAACAALLRTLADGRSHRIDALATAAFGTPGRRADLVAALDALADAGMTLVRDGDAVVARAFVPLDETTLRRALPTFDVAVSGAIDSTNSALARRVRTSPPLHRPLVLAAEWQYAGRGRLGRQWTSAPGASLTVSFAMPIDRPLAALAGVTLVCGLAACDALDDEGVAAGLKWPNDLVVDDHKLGGILVEACGQGETSAIVVGVGVNVAARNGPRPPGGLPPTDLVRCGARLPDRNRIVATLARALEQRLDRFARLGFAAFVDAWMARDACRDRPVVLRTNGGAANAVVHAGIARGVDVDGALRLEVDGAVVRIVNGDLSLRPAPDGVRR